MILEVQKIFWQLCTVKLLFPYDPATVLLDVYSQELKTSIYTKSCTWIFIAALFVNFQNKEANQDVLQ